MTPVQIRNPKRLQVATLSQLADRVPTYALVANVDLVLVRYGDQVSALFGRCLHRGALLSDGYIDGDNLMCGVHGWDYRYDTGVSSYNNEERLAKFSAWVDGDGVFVDETEIREWERENPQSYDRAQYQGLYADTHGAPEEPFTGYIQKLARDGLRGADDGGDRSSTQALGLPQEVSRDARGDRGATDRV